MKTKSLLLTIAATFGMSALIMAQNVPNYVPTNGLVGWWPFNGNANDESGNGNNGTVNSATLTVDRFGNANKAYNFDGIDDYIQCINAGPTGNPVITVSFWMKTTQTATGQIFGYGSNAGSGQDFRIYINGQCSPALFFDTYDNAKALATTFNNTWDFYTVVYNGGLGNNTNSASIFKNGIMLSSVCFSVNISLTNISSSIPITFGRYHGTAQSIYYNGTLDDIGIWNRALTQQEITDLYNAVNCANNTTISPPTNSLTTGSTANFTASTSDPNPSYVWQSDFGQGFVTLNNFGNYSGANTGTLNIANVQLPNHTQPIRVITTSGICIDTSNVSVINILDTCITNVTVYDTLLTTVTDTLIINTQITGINPPNNSNTITVFPNPASTHITIDYGNFAIMNGYQLVIENSIGQQVFQTNITQQSDYLSLSTWGANGLYFVHIIDPQGNTIDIRKIVLQ